MRRLLALVVLLATLAGCGGYDVTGRYEAVGPGGSDAPVLLILKAEGKGVLSFNGEDAPFTWDVRDRGRALWLHTKDGGVLAGTLGSDSIEMDIPGAGRLAFRRTARE